MNYITPYKRSPWQRAVRPKKFRAQPPAFSEGGYSPGNWARNLVIGLGVDVSTFSATYYGCRLAKVAFVTIIFKPHTHSSLKGHFLWENLFTACPSVGGRENNALVRWMSTSILT